MSIIVNYQNICVVFWRKLCSSDSSWSTWRIYISEKQFVSVSTREETSLRSFVLRRARYVKRDSQKEISTFSDLNAAPRANTSTASGRVSVGSDMIIALQKLMDMGGRFEPARVHEILIQLDMTLLSLKYHPYCNLTQRNIYHFGHALLSWNGTSDANFSWMNQVRPSAYI